jgi:hypothetical protein
MTEMITEEELAGALTALGYSARVHRALPRLLFDYALNHRGSQLSPQDGDEETLTANELDAAFKRLGYPITGDAIMNNVLARRESPEPWFNVGDIVRSDAGLVYVKLADGNWRDVREGRPRHPSYPTRPLVKIGVAT